MTIKVRTNDAAHAQNIRQKTGVLVAIRTDRTTGRKLAWVRWDGNKTQTSIAPRFIEYVK